MFRLKSTPNNVPWWLQPIRCPDITPPISQTKSFHKSWPTTARVRHPQLSSALQVRPLLTDTVGSLSQSAYGPQPEPLSISPTYKTRSTVPTRGGRRPSCHRRAAPPGCLMIRPHCFTSVAGPLLARLLLSSLLPALQPINCSLPRRATLEPE